MPPLLDTRHDSQRSTGSEFLDDPSLGGSRWPPIANTMFFFFSKKKDTFNERGRPLTVRVTSCARRQKKEKDETWNTKAHERDARERMKQGNAREPHHCSRIATGSNELGKALSSRSHLFMVRRPCRRCDAHRRKKLLPLVGFGIHSSNTCRERPLEGAACCHMDDTFSAQVNGHIWS